jgi:GDPmannose 4,6-dehydratase
VREFVERAFHCIGVTIAWKGNGIDETGVDAATGVVRVAIDSRYFRPTEVNALRGNPAKARKTLGWRHTIGFEQLVQNMVDSDRKLLTEQGPGTAGMSR